ncbi:MAG TPA: hypothetical protein VGG68_15725 [Caulobacteraceae bacterium]|jgi:hypothetical protein
MPKILDRAVSKIKARGGVSNPWAVAVSAMQKSGNLKAGTLQATKQGVKRGAMTETQRQANPPKAK